MKKAPLTLFSFQASKICSVYPASYPKSNVTYIELESLFPIEIPLYSFNIFKELESKVGCSFPLSSF